MTYNEMIYESLDQVFRELAEERPDLEYFRELDKEWELETIKVTVKGTERLFA